MTLSGMNVPAQDRPEEGAEKMNRTNFKRIMLLSSASLAARIFAAPVMAQKEPSELAPPELSAEQEQAEDDGEPVLEEIVVTADRKNSYGADYVQAGSFRG